MVTIRAYSPNGPPLMWYSLPQEVKPFNLVSPKLGWGKSQLQKFFAAGGECQAAKWSIFKAMVVLSQLKRQISILWRVVCYPGALPGVQNCRHDTMSKVRRAGTPNKIGAYTHIFYPCLPYLQGGISSPGHSGGILMSAAAVSRAGPGNARYILEVKRGEVWQVILAPGATFLSTSGS